MNAVGPDKKGKSKEDRMSDIKIWCQKGGGAALDSYGLTLKDLEYKHSFDEEVNIPESLKKHLEYVSTLDSFYETDTHIFTHASPDLLTPVSEQPEEYHIWRRVSSTDKNVGYKHSSGKKIVCGHTPSDNDLPIVLSEDYAIIDTVIDNSFCFKGWLTGMCVDDGSFIQSSANKVRKLNQKGEICSTIATLS